MWWWPPAPARCSPTSTASEYLDFLAAYSATNFGHGHPALVAAAREQLDRVTLTSRAFHHDQLAPLRRRAGPAGRQGDGAADEHRRRGRGDRRSRSPGSGATRSRACPTAGRRSSSPPATSTAGPRRSSASPTIRWPMIISARTLQASSPSRTATWTRWPRRDHRRRRRGPAGADPGRGRRTHPAAGLPGRRTRADPGSTACCSSPTRSSPAWAGPAAPWPVSTRTSSPTSTCWARRWAGASCRCRRSSPTPMCSGCCKPGQHGSTFGGNPLACAVGRAVVDLLATGDYQRRATVLGARMRERLDGMVGRGVVGVRSRGLWAGVDIDPAWAAAVSCARRWPGGGCWSRTPTARPSGWPRRS